MPPWVLDAAVLDHTDVEPIAEHPAHPVDRERARRTVAPGAHTQSSSLHLGRELLQRVLTGGVEPECLGDERCALRIVDDVCHAPARLPLLAVEIADRSAVDPATHLRLLAHPLLHLG